jgi:uncharacterized protein (TIGR03435 family)
MNRAPFSVAFGLIVVLGVPLSSHQSPSGDQTTFDVASVKRNMSGDAYGTAGPQPGGRFVMVNLPVLRLIRAAYSVLNPSQIVGAPEWVSAERYDVTAAAGGDTSAPEMERMLRELLAERFKLRTHFESRDQDAFALVRATEIGPLPPQLRQVRVDCVTLTAQPGTSSNLPRSSNGAPPCGLVHDGQKLAAGGITMAQFARNLTPLVGRPVVDRTGLVGHFEFTLEYATREGNAAGVPAANDSRPSIVAALHEQLGLRLDSRRMSVDVLVIDSVDRPGPD